jgi:PAS domain S-box-containing protein
MAPASFSFIDIAALDGIRTRFASGQALVVLSPELDEVVWANGAGARFLGHADIEAAIGSPAGLEPALRRRITALAGFPEVGEDRQVVLRMGGFRNALGSFSVSAQTLPDRTPALLLSVPAANAPASEAPAAAIAGFGSAGHFAALIDEAGAVAAASPGFDELGIAEEALRDLVAAVRGEADRLVKRRLPGRRLYPAAIARLTDEPALHLLVLVDEPAAPPVEESRAPEPAAPTGREGEAQADDDVGHENWYFGPEETPAGPAEPDRRESPPAVGGRDREAREKRAPEPEAGQAPARFAWRVDEETRFVSISEAFVDAVGEPAADIVGRRFRDVANAFGLDPAGEISALMERRDTWSGRTVMWPLAGTSLKAPVDLAALPVYARGRVFEGFRGFGIVRIAEAVEDPEAIGLALMRTLPAEVVETPEPLPRGEEIEPVSQEAQASAPPATDEKVIRLAEHRANSRQQADEERDGRLSVTERSAFREIADRLRRYTADDAGRPSGEQNATPTAGPADEPAPVAAPDETTRPAEASSGNAGAPAPRDEAPAAEAVDTPASAADDPAAAPPADEPVRPANIAFLPSAFSRGDRQGAGIDPSVLAHLPVPVLVHAGDVLHYANPEFLSLTGYGDIGALAAEGGLDALFADPYESRMAEDRTLALRTAGGDELPVRAHLQSVPWNGGKALLLALRPVERAAEPVPAGPSAAELQVRVEEMRTIVDTATDGVVIIDNEGMIRSISRPAEALFGLESEDVAGRPFSALFAIESQRAAEDYLNSLSDNGVASVLNDGREVIGREGRGRFIPLFMTMGRLPNDSGYCAVVRDITQWKRAEEELTQARSRAEHTSSQKSEFLARVSHEIRTPLNAIIGFSELMMDEKFGPIGSDRYRDYLRDINRSGNHVLDLVNDLLDISKIEAGEQEMHYEAVSLNDTLGESVALMQPQANRERVIIRSSFASNLPEVVADLRSVRQIALNLLSNAVRYTPAGGQVIVSTSYEQDGSVIMRVRDTGLGMSSGELEQALKPFKQINALKRRRGDGTGLGLPLTRAMVEANRARFSIDSTPGRGTLVEITFPPTRVLAD